MNVLAIVIAGGIGLLGILYYIIDSRKAWWIIRDMTGQKHVTEEQDNTYAPSKDYSIKFWHKKLGTIPYNGINDLAGDAFALLDKNSLPIDGLDNINTNQLRHKNVKPFLKSHNGTEFVYEIVNKDSYDLVEEENIGLHAEVTRLQGELAASQKIGEQYLRGHAKTHNRVMRDLYMGRKTGVQTSTGKTKISSSQQQSNTGMESEGGEEG